jgi:hypothetical protein
MEEEENEGCSIQNRIEYLKTKTNKGKQVNKWAGENTYANELEYENRSETGRR